VVFSKLKSAIGLGRARMCVSGAAPIAREVLEFFAGIDIPIREVYGQSEDTGPTSFNLPGKTKLGTVGTAIPGVSVKIADDGEILVKGPNVFMGYYKDPEATAQTLEDGWLRSGDLGQFDSEGFLSITGRKKEIIITAGGENIAPSLIENLLKEHPLVGQALAYGDGRRYVVAVLTLDGEVAPAWAAARGIEGDLADLAAHPLVLEEIARAVEAANGRLARVQQVKRWRLLPDEWTAESEELTPTLKLKRRVIHSKYADTFAALYET
jgi:long-chain acyl-CoA synthetase